MIIYDVWSSTLHYDPGTFPTLFMDLWEYRQMLDYHQSCPILPCPEHYTHITSSVILLMQNVKLYWQIHINKYLSTSIFNQFISNNFNIVFLFNTKRAILTCISGDNQKHVYFQANIFSSLTSLESSGHIFILCAHFRMAYAILGC